MSAPVLDLAKALGEHLRQQAAARGCYSREPGPAFTWTGDFDTYDTPGTLEMRYDGDIDLVAAVQAILQAAEPSISPNKPMLSYPKTEG